VLNRLKEQRGLPQLLFCDNGSEFTGQMMDLWAYRNGVKIDFFRPGKPTDNAFCESFDGTFRSECLDANWFQSLAEAKQVIEAWRQEYNVSRPHRALADRTPAEFASHIAASRDMTETKTGQRLTLYLVQFLPSPSLVPVCLLITGTFRAGHSSYWFVSQIEPCSRRSVQPRIQNDSRHRNPKWSV